MFEAIGVLFVTVVLLMLAFGLIGNAYFDYALNGDMNWKFQVVAIVLGFACLVAWWLLVGTHIVFGFGG